MLTGHPGQPPQVAQAFPVQPQQLHRSPSDWCKPDNFQEVVTPNKVVIPIVLAGVIYRNLLFGERVDSRYFVGFSAITATAGKREVAQFGFAAFIKRKKMVNIEGVDGIPSPTLAILAAFSGPFLDS